MKSSFISWTLVHRKLISDWLLWVIEDFWCLQQEKIKNMKEEILEGEKEA